METTYPTATIDIDADDDEARVWRWKLTVALRRLHFPEPLAFAVANERPSFRRARARASPPTATRRS